MPLYITEYAFLARDGANYHIAAGREPAIAEQTVSVSGTSAQSSAFNAQTRFVMIHASESLHLLFGDNPTAVVTKHKMASGETRFYGVNPGDKVAAIAGS